MTQTQIETTDAFADLFADDAFEGVFVAQLKNEEEDPSDESTEPLVGEALMKEELKDVNEKYKDVIAEEEAAGKIQEPTEPTIERVTGVARSRKDRQHADLIYAEQSRPYHSDATRKTTHDILPSEIYSISVRRHYTDLEVMPAGSRTLIRENIWVLHHGYYRYSQISREQLQELLDNKLIKPSIINYVFGDAVSGLSVFLKKDQEPGDREIKEAIEAFERTQNLNFTPDENLVVADVV